MSNSVIDEFVSMVVYDHAVATGLKACTTDQEIVDYAASRDFVFSIMEWNRYVESDLASAALTESESLAIQAISKDHWSWAFRKVAPWRAMLMDGT